MASTFGTDPLGSYYSTIATEMASSNPNTAAVGALGASTAPTVAQQETQFAGIEQQLGDLGPGLAQQGDYATALAGYQLGNLGIQNQESQISNQGTQQQYALTQQQQQQQAQENQLNYTRQLQGQVQGAASSGTLNTGGNVQAQQDIGQQAEWAGQNLSRQEQLSAGDYARAQEQFGLMGQANGLSAAEVQTRLGYGLEQLGESADPSSLVSQAGNILSGSVQGVGNTLSQAGLLGGLNALAGLG